MYNDYTPQCLLNPPGRPCGCKSHLGEPMDAESAEVFKVTVKNSQGNPIVSYVLPKGKQSYVRAMTEEYGVAAIEPMMMADLPEGVALEQ